MSGRERDVYRAAIIGVRGGIARGRPSPDVWRERWTLPHSHASAYASHPRVKVVAVCDLVPEYMEQYERDWEPVAKYTDYREMLKREDLQLVSVVTGDHLHAQMVVDAAEAGVAGVFCEKPLATTLADADRMVAAVEKHGTKMIVNHTRRWDPFWRQVKTMIEDGRLGALSRVVAYMGGPRSMLFRNGTHLIDAMCMYIGADPLWLIGEMEEGYEDRTVYQGDGGHDPSTDPGASAYIHFANGVRGYVEMAKSILSCFEVEVFCAKGRIRMSDVEAILYLESDTHKGEVTSRPLGGNLEFRSGMVQAVDELVALIENGGESISSGREALRSLEIMIAIMRSQAQGVTKIHWPLARE
jgi:UDP-N-acetyl-2-amino-2-deoxyglucuronate dehydrogenase